MPSNFWHQHMIAVGFTSPNRMFSSQDSNLGLLSNTTLSSSFKYLSFHATHYYYRSHETILIEIKCNFIFFTNYKNVKCINFFRSLYLTYMSESLKELMKMETQREVIDVILLSFEFSAENYGFMFSR